MSKYLFIFLLVPFIAFSQSNYKNVDIQLVTISPGQYYWEAFGHSAIRVKAPTYDYIYGFGHFNFEDENFFLNFAKGNMQYYLGVDYADYELFRYKSQGREVKLQSLNLDSNQKKHIIQELSSLNNDEDRYYSYDYFENNCTSRIRDLIDKISDNKLSTFLSKKQTSRSLFDATFPVANQSWINLAFAIVYGLPAYEEKNQWQLSVFPVAFSEDISNTIKNVDFVKRTSLWYEPNEFERKISESNFLKTHFALFLVFLLFAIGLLVKVTSVLAGNIYLVLQSVIGVILLLLWFASNHSIATMNINVLLFIPLAFLLIFKKFKKPITINIFLLVNLFWLISAWLLTSIYLVGFFILNILIWFRLKQSL